MSLENTNSRASANGLDLLRYNKIISEKEIIEDINNTTINDIQEILKDIITTVPTVAIYGKVKNVYTYDEIKAKLK